MHICTLHAQLEAQLQRAQVLKVECKATTERKGVKEGEWVACDHCMTQGSECKVSTFDLVYLLLM